MYATNLPQDIKTVGIVANEMTRKILKKASKANTTALSLAKKLIFFARSP